MNSDYWKSSTWTFSNRGSYEELSAPKGGLLYRDTLKTRASGSPDLELHMAISHHLPSWVFLYLTPASERVSKRRGETPVPAIPLLLQQRRVLVFIEPDVNAKSAPG